MTTELNSDLTLETQLPYLEEILTPWKAVIGDDYSGYKSHVCRMVQFCWAIKQSRGELLSDDDKKKIIIAGAFHDIGIWVGNTLDYLDPSVPPAMEYLESQGLSDWKQEIQLMITEHHKLSPFTDALLDQKTVDIVELFRQGDITDFTLGMVNFHLPKAYINAMKAAIPNQGFHLGLLKKGMKWFIRHPLNPAPMMKR